MMKTGRKNAAGGWVLREFLQRIGSAGMLFMAVVGIALGFLIQDCCEMTGEALH